MSRPLQPPARPDAVPMPEGDSRDWLRHPGPERATRFDALPCKIRRAALSLRAGDNLMAGIAREMEALAAEGGLVFLDGLEIHEMNYVMPDGPSGSGHAAWYSDTHTHHDIRIENGPASVGRRDGQWWLHSHARWTGPKGAKAMGHLLPDQITLAADAELPVILTSGARYEVSPDAETGFSVFRPRATAPEISPEAPPEALLVTIQPHTDIRGTIEAAAAAHGIAEARIHGIGSLIGARFLDGPPMLAPVSEVAVLPGARLEAGRVTWLPVAAVDHEAQIHQGDLAPGAGPVCVTCELLIVAA